MGVTLADVAETAGVSQATASRVLSGKRGVVERTRAAVISAADSLGYTRPRTSRGRGRVIGVVLPELVNPVFAAFADRLAAGLGQRGCTPVLCTQTGVGSVGRRLGGTVAQA